MKFTEAVKDTWKGYKVVWSSVNRRGSVRESLKEAVLSMFKAVDQAASVLLVVLCLPLFPVGVVVRMYKGWKKQSGKGSIKPIKNEW